MTQCLPQSPTANSPEVKSGTGSPFEFRRKKSSSSPPTPTTPTPPTTPKLQPLHKTNNKMLQQQEASPKLQPVNSTLQHQTAQIQHAPPQLLQQQHVQQPHMQANTIGVKSGDGLVRYSFDLEVDYITERLIAVSFPAGGLENQYRSNLRDVVRMLKSKHQNSYIIFNLSRRRHDITKLNQEVRDLGWPNVLAPPLERLCSICKQMETWMKTNPNNVVVLHCKGGRGPIGVVVSAYMHYISITSAGDSGSDRYAMSRFLDARARGTMHPSQLRYVDYFTGLLTNSIQINSSPLFLHHVVLHGVPNYDSNGGCRPFLRIYQGMHPVFTSGVYTVPEGTSRFVITPDRALPLRGDILVKCYHKKFRSTTRDTVFRCQFHTTAVMEYRLIFQKPELDDACTDARFPEFTKVELIFSSTPDALHGSDYMAADTFPSEHIDDPLIRWDSYEHFNDIIEGPEDGGMDLDEKSGSNNNNNMILEIPHSSAPDGALYAQVKKTPSPEQSPMIPAHHPRPPPPLTNGDATSPTPYVLSPDRAPQVQPQREGKRHMDYRERMALDELLKGITGEGTDGGIVVNNNTQWKAPPSPDNQVLHHEPSLTRRIVSVSEDLRHAPIPQNKPKPAPLIEEEPPTPSGPVFQSSPVKKAPVSRKESSEAENPYAEITEAMQQQQQQQQQQASPNPNTNPRGPYQETITPVVQTREQAAPPMVNGGVNVPRTIEQHNPIYEVTKTASRGSAPNGQVTQNGGLIGNGQINLNPGQNGGIGNPGHAPQSYGSPAGSYNPGQVGPVRPHIAQINGPVETPIVPNSISRVTERTPTLSRLQNGPTSPPMTQYEPRPLKAKEERFQLLKKDPNQPLQLQQQQPIRQQQQQQQLPSPTTPPQVSPVPSGSGEDEDGGMGWLKRQQDKLREKREREQGRPIFSSPSPSTERVPEPMRANSVNASPKLRVRFEGDPQSPGPTMVSPPVASSFKDGSPSWLSQQQQKLQDRQNVEPALISPMSYVTTESTPVFSSTTTPLRDQPYDAGRRGTPPAPLTLSSDLERSINELGHVDNAKPSQMYVQRTMTTRTTTTGSEWEPHERPLNRQLSDLTHDRVRDPVYQRPAVEQAPKVPATPGTPYDPVPPILTNAQLRGNGPQATSTPKKEFDEVDLHIDEPAAQTNVPRGLVADRSPNYMDRSLSPPPSQPPQSRPPRRTNSQSGYDSDTGIQQYYRPPRRRNLIDPGAEVWLQNPGGLPRKENEFWNKTEGLKSPEASKAPEYDLSSSTESISGPKTPTPRFPVGPKAYANMMKTFIVKTGAPPHGPDQPLPLQRTMRRQDSDTFDNGPLPIPMGSAVAPEVYSPPPPPPPAPAPMVAPMVAPQPVWEEQPSYTERRVITVEQRSEPAAPRVWTPTPQPAPLAPRTTGPGDDPLRQLEYLEDEPWMGRKPVLPTPPRRTTDPLVPEPWSPPPGTTTMITTGPIQTFPNGVPQTTTTTQWRTREFIQQPIDIKPIVVDVRQEEEGERRKSPRPIKVVEEVVQQPSVTPKERAFVPQYVREVNAAPPLPPSSPPQPQAPLPKLSPPEQPRVIPYSEPQPLPQPAYHQQPPQQRILEPPITEVRLHGVEVGPIQVVPIEAQVVKDRKGQYPMENTQQGMPAASMPNQVPTTTRTYQYQQTQQVQQSAPVPQSYAPVTPPQASRGIVQTTSPPLYGTVQSAAPPASYSTVQQQVTPPMSYGTMQSSPQRAVVSSPGQDSTIIQQRMEVREITQTESVPVAHAPAPPQQQASPQLQQHLPLIQQQNQQQLQQELPRQPAPQDEQPSPTHNERLLNQPKPPVQYPTFSDRHRKAAKGPADDSLPNGGAGYRTIYDNRRQQRASLGNEGQLPSPGGLSGKSGLNGSATPPTLSGRSTPSNFYYTQRLSPYGSSSSLADPSVEHVRFVKDLSGWWYKPNISRDDAINILKDKTPGTFVVRDSNSFPGAFGLALKVAQIPANTTPRKGGDPQSELVRHFLIEPNARGVRLKGCANEPVFSSLSALVYQHTLTQLALPIKLVLPDTDPSGTDTTDSTLDPKSAAALLQQGAACKVLYIDSVSMESLTGSEAIREALTKTLTAKKKPDGIVVHFKVSSKGITVTDTQRKLFFRKHYPVKSILYCGMDPHSRKCPRREGQEVAEAKIFGFISRKPGSLTDNECHLFADWEVEQPASAIVSFVTKVMLGSTSSSRSSVKTP